MEIQDQDGLRTLRCGAQMGLKRGGDGDDDGADGDDDDDDGDGDFDDGDC